MIQLSCPYLKIKHLCYTLLNSSPPWNPIFNAKISGADEYSGDYNSKSQGNYGRRAFGFITHFSRNLSRRTLKSSAAATSNGSTTAPTLYSRLTPIGNPNVSIVPILDQWVQEGRPIDQQDLHKIIKQFRKFKRFNHALEVT